MTNSEALARIYETYGEPETGSAEEETKCCPECGEIILAIARKCKHCHSVVPRRSVAIFTAPSEEELLNAKDEPDAEIIERFLGIRGIRVDTYSAIQREFGWDDTH